ncbi:T9SS type A sorting domain-containing protein [bacterium]|nr:T9SS type A sorting domain-containing protein [bacterium]
MLRAILILSFLISSIFSFNIENSINDHTATIEKKIKNDNNRNETIEAGNMYFSPQDLVIDVGDTVEWINVGGTHDVDGTTDNVTGEPWNNPEDFYLSTVSVGNGADPVSMGSVTFDTPGFYNYDCGLGSHAENGMVGTITVNAVSNTCDDEMACNFGEEGECQYADIGLGGICDCDGNIFDCSGECGGTDLTCTIMEGNDMGVYENDDCTGELTSLAGGMCMMIIDGDQDISFLDEAECIASGGIFLATDTCHGMDMNMDIADQGACNEIGGLWLETFDEYGNLEIAICIEITVIDGIDNEYDCENNDNYMASFWLPNMVAGMQLFYFYEDGTFSVSIEEQCRWTDNFPTEYDCLMYGGNWDSGDDIGEQCDGLDSTNCLMLDGQWLEAGLLEAGTWLYEDGGFFIDPNALSGAPDQFAGADLVMDEDGNWLSLDLRFLDYISPDELECAQWGLVNIDSSLDNSGINIPSDISIDNIYPNPFNPTTTINFSVSNSSSISINLYDINGHLVQNITEGYYGTGSYSKLIDGSRLTSGAYFIRLETDNYSITEKLMLIK